MTTTTAAVRTVTSWIANACLGSSLVVFAYDRLNTTRLHHQKKEESIEQCLKQQHHSKPKPAVVSSNTSSWCPLSLLLRPLLQQLPPPPLVFVNVTTTRSALCEQSRKQKQNDDSFPNFARHGNGSILKKYLTRDVYEQLRHVQTSSGITLDDIITCGVALPLGAHPPRGLGVYAGDAECYTMFAPLLNPMIDEYHGTGTSTVVRKRNSNSNGSNGSTWQPILRRHATNLDPELVLSQKPDPSGEYVLFTRMRVARSIEGFLFPPSMSRSERRQVCGLVQGCVNDWKDENDDDDGGSGASSGKFVSLYEMSNVEHDDLIRRHILFHDPDEWAIYGGLGRDWPDGRGVYCNDWEHTPNVMVWCNAEDHIRVISMRKGGDLHGVFTALSKTVQAMEHALHVRGHKFVYDDRLGYLNSCPTNLGTALRASVFVKLVRLGRQPGFKDLAKRLKLQVTTGYGHTDRRYTGIFDVSNSERLGQSEVQLLNIMIQGVGKLIELEKKLERGETINLNEIAT